MARVTSAARASAVDQDGRPIRSGYRRRGGEADGGGGFAIGLGLVARIVQLVVSIVVLIIVLGILLVVLKANPTNSIASQIHDWARSLAGPFDDMFSFHNAHVAIAVNWGIAAIAYLCVGGLIARLIGRGNR